MKQSRKLKDANKAVAKAKKKRAEILEKDRVKHEAKLAEKAKKLAKVAKKKAKQLAETAKQKGQVKAATAPRKPVRTASGAAASTSARTSAGTASRTSAGTASRTFSDSNTVAELRSAARLASVPGYSRLTKAQLLDALH
jgi:hypothetical protein